jgi:polar amino acid transport system substrate-binding protein
MRTWGLAMRKWIPLVTALLVLAAACAPEEEPSEPTGSNAGGGATTAAECASSLESDLVEPGSLTIGTGNPAFPPWWGGGTSKEHSEWEINDPYKGKGFEGATVFAVAKELGFSPSDIEFVPVPFAESFAPGPKDFDFVLQQISYSKKRAERVDFSESYYDVNQALVSQEGSPIEDASSFGDLQDAKLGAQIGTTGYDYIVDNVQPSAEPSAYPGLTGAISDLKSGSIDGLVTDLPSAFFITAVQIPKGVIVGQFPTVGSQEYFAMAFEKGSPLVECVNKALTSLKESGDLAALQEEWLANKASAPVIED